MLTMRKETLDQELKHGWMVNRNFTVRKDQADAITDTKDTVNWSAVVRNAIQRKLDELKKETDNAKP